MIKNNSANALSTFAAILLIIGLMIMSPSGAFFTFTAAAIFAAVPALFGRGKIRIIACLMLFAAIFLAANKYPDYQNERERINKRVKISRCDFPPNINSHFSQDTGRPSEEKCSI